MSLCLVFLYLLLEALHCSHYVMAFALLWELVLSLEVTSRPCCLKPLNLWTQGTFSFIVSLIYFLKQHLMKVLYTHIFIYIYTYAHMGKLWYIHTLKWYLKTYLSQEKGFTLLKEVQWLSQKFRYCQWGQIEGWEN